MQAMKLLSWLDSAQYYNLMHQSCEHVHRLPPGSGKLGTLEML